MRLYEVVNILGTVSGSLPYRQATDRIQNGLQAGHWPSRSSNILLLRSLPIYTCSSMMRAFDISIHRTRSLLGDPVTGSTAIITCRLRIVSYPCEQGERAEVENLEAQLAEAERKIKAAALRYRQLEETHQRTLAVSLKNYDNKEPWL